jgi:hypothetical protein
MPVQTQLQQRRGTAASWTSTNPTLAAGEIGFESDTGKIKIGTGSTAWNALAYTASSTAVTYLYNATAAQTTFSGADANGLTLAYTVGAEQVYLNGALQVRGSDYTATNGTSIVLTSGALVNDVLNVIAFSALALSDTYTQAQADARFVQQSTNFFAGKNRIINGDFSINQRNLTTTSTDGAYGFDRFYWSGIDGTNSYSAQTFTPGAAPVAGYEAINFARVASSGQTLVSAQTTLRQKIEDVRTFAGQPVTVSFWAKANTGTPSIAVELTQNFGSGGSAAVTGNISTKQAITTSWARYTWTGTLPSVSGKTIGTSSFIDATIWLSAGTNFNARTGSLGIQSNTFDIWGVQVEYGSIATPFETATGTIQGELAACQRYYWLVANGSGKVFCNVGAYSATQINAAINFPITMRTTPTLEQTTGTGYFVSTVAGTDRNFSSLILSAGNTNTQGGLIYVTGLSGMTAGQAGYFATNNASSFLAFTSEL